MRRKALSPMHSEHVNVTPLIDVVMCLVIFFLLCGQLARNESSDKVRIPRAQQGDKLPEQRGRLVINLVPPSRELALPVRPGEAPEVVIRGRSVPLESLPALLRHEKQENSELKVIVRADEDLTYDGISPVLVACAQADIQSVNFSTEK